MARSRSKAKSVAKPARRRSSRRSVGARAHEAALAAFAHDIRTALTGILALGELLASSTLGDSERSWAASIKASAEHLASLTTLVLDAAKADTGSLTLREEVFRPRRLVEFLADSLATRAQAKGLAAEANIADNLPDLLVGDAVRLRAALENLIDNAVKFTERGAVRLEARASPAGRGLTRLVVAVHDSGIGLKPAEIKRLFRPFAQASAEIARHYGGSGLGLAIVKRLAKLMGGDLTVASTPGRGSSFRFTAVMPIVSADAAGSPSWPGSSCAKPLGQRWTRLRRWPAARACASRPGMIRRCARSSNITRSWRRFIGAATPCPASRNIQRSTRCSRLCRSGPGSESEPERTRRP